MVKSEGDLKIGKEYQAQIISCSSHKEEALNLKYSSPLQIQVSPFIRGSIPFSQIVSTDDLVKHGSEIIKSKKFTVGQMVTATFIGDGSFSLLEKDEALAMKDRQFKKG